MSERPQYGELATPEEQAAASGIVLPPESPAVATAEVAAEPRKRARSWDAALTLALLAFGTISVINGVALYADMGSTINTFYASLGYDGAFAAPAWTSAASVALRILEPVALVVAILLSALSLRAGRISFWIPLSFGVLVTLISAVVLTSLALSDPGFVAYFTSRSAP
jgi:type IV secretory pathway TrbD component